MPDDTTPDGLLTQVERRRLVEDSVDADERAAIRARVRDRLRTTLRDFSILYPRLTDEDVAAVFDPDSPRERSTVRSATQDALGLLVLGMLANDDLLETRLTDALESAAMAHGDLATVDLEVRREPLPSIEDCLGRFEPDFLNDVTFRLYEHVLWAGTPEQIVTASERLGEEVSLAEAREQVADLHELERLPQTAITGVEVDVVDSPPETDQNSDTSEYRYDP